jgi:DNA-binding GntR family transcriptional regulator
MEANLGNQKAFMLANSQFHLDIYAHAGSPMLLQLIRWLWVRIGPYLVMSSTEDQNRRTMQLHHGMFEAFVQRDAGKMRRCLQEDLRRAAKIIVEMLESATGTPATGPSRDRWSLARRARGLRVPVDPRESVG